MRTRKFFAIAAGVAAALAPAMVFVTAAPAGATTVTTEAALRTAFADPAETSIVLANDISLEDCQSGDLDRDSGVALTLDGAGFTVTQTCTDERVMETHTDLTLQNVTITGGNLGKGDGGGILAAGALTLDGVHVTGNSAADSGGGVSQDQGDLVVTSSVIDDNQTDLSFGEAGGIAKGSGNMLVTDSTIADNDASYAGGFFRYGGGPDTETVSIVRSTISGNTSNDGAGGLDSLKKITLVNSTVTGNVSAPGEGSGGGIAVTDTLTLVYSTVVGNSASFGSNVAVAADLVSFGSVVADPLGGGENCDIADVTTSQGYNFADDTSCDFTAATDRQGPGNNPLLGALAANGGPTLTMLPQTGSPLLDAIPAASCQAGIAAGITTDQRGVARPQGTGCDIGAVEVVVEAPAPAPAVVQPRFTG